MDASIHSNRPHCAEERNDGDVGPTWGEISSYRSPGEHRPFLDPSFIAQNVHERAASSRTARLQQTSRPREKTTPSITPYKSLRPTDQIGRLRRPCEGISRKLVYPANMSAKSFRSLRTHTYLSGRRCLPCISYRGNLLMSSLTRACSSFDFVWTLV